MYIGNTSSLYFLHVIYRTLIEIRWRYKCFRIATYYRTRYNLFNILIEERGAIRFENLLRESAGNTSNKNFQKHWREKNTCYLEPISTRTTVILYRVDEKSARRACFGKTLTFIELLIFYF